MHEKIVYLNGSFVPESEAKVSVLDMGFHAGDGVYDVTRTFRHKPFKLKEHNDRLFRSLKYTRIDCGMSQDEMEAAALEVIERNKGLLGPDDDYAVWQVISRGARSSKGPRTNTNATVAIYCMDVDFTGFCRHYVEGVTIVVPATRRIPPQCLESKAKITNKMNHIIATFEARQADPKAIPLMLDLDGNIAESNAHNFFAVVGGKIYTPGSKNVLGGITRAVLGGAVGPAGPGGGGDQPDPLRLPQCRRRPSSPAPAPPSCPSRASTASAFPRTSRPRDPAAAQGLGRARGRGHRRPGHRPHGRGGEGRIDGRVEREAGGPGAVAAAWHRPCARPTG